MKFAIIAIAVLSLSTIGAAPPFAARLMRKRVVRFAGKARPVAIVASQSIRCAISRKGALAMAKSVAIVVTILCRASLGIVASVALIGCSSAHSSRYGDFADDDDVAANVGDDSANSDFIGDAGSRDDFDESAARAAAENEVAGESYSSIGSPYGCTQDCSGHEAGFAWRRDNGFSTPGYSQSFEEGGQAYDEAVEDRVQEMRDDYDAGEDPGY